MRTTKEKRELYRLECREVLNVTGSWCHGTGDTALMMSELLDDLDFLESQVAARDALLARAEVIIKRDGHPGNGSCSIDHYTDRECDCDTDALLRDLSALKGG